MKREKKGGIECGDWKMKTMREIMSDSVPDE